MKQRLRPDRCDSCLISSRRFKLSKQVGGVLAARNRALDHDLLAAMTIESTLVSRKTEMRRPRSASDPAVHARLRAGRPPACR